MILATLAACLVAQGAAPVATRPFEPIVGVVSDPDGLPVEAAELFLIGLSDYAEDPEGVLVLGRSHSDRAGRFQVGIDPRFRRGPAPRPRAVGLVAVRSGFAVTGCYADGTDMVPPGEPFRVRLKAAVPRTFEVRDREGRPVPGARVASSLLRWSPLPADLADQFAAVADNEGRATLTEFPPEDIVETVTSAPGFGAQCDRFYPRESGVRTITLQPAGRLVVRVTADDPAHAPGVRLRGLISPPGRASRDHGARFEARTDASGRIELPAVMAGALSLEPPLLPVDSPCFALPVRPATVEPGGRAEVEVRLARGLPVRGCVYDVTCDPRGPVVLAPERPAPPVAGAVVRLTVEQPFFKVCRVRTDASGRYTAFLPPGEVEFGIEDSLPYYIGCMLPMGVRTPSPVPGPDDRGGEIHVFHARDIGGIVVDDAGRPIAGAVVDVATAFGAPCRRTWANARGEFLLRDMDQINNHQLSARTAGACTGDIAVNTLFQKPAPLTLRARAADAGSIAGRVVGEDGAPVADAEVLISERPRLPNDRAVERFVSIDGPAGALVLRTDADGRFRSPRCLRVGGDYRLSGEAIDRRVGQSPWFRLSRGSEAAVSDLVLKPASP